MAEIKEFVVNDRRKFTAEGELRPDAPPSEPKPPRPETIHPPKPPADAYDSSARLTGPQAVPDKPAEPAAGSNQPAPADSELSEGELPPPPTAEQTDQANRAYSATVDRLDTAIRATNPGMERIPEMTFERLIQSIYMQTILQLGGATEPGQEPHVDLLGARQSIDMLGIIADKSRGNLSDSEDKLIESALFEMRMAFLELTQALARQAQQRQTATPGAPPPPTGPSIVR
jgi:hypothetical protein